MILVIFAGAGAGLILLTISAIDMNYAREAYDSYDPYDSFDDFFTTLAPPSRDVRREVKALATCMLALSIVEGIIACISFGITCHGLCCRSTQGTVITTVPAVAAVQTQPSVTVTRTVTTSPCPQYGYNQGMIHQAPTGYGQPPPAYSAGPPQPPAYTNVV
ncbi:uncharacterized protein LOC106176822 isoform X2 [Lingula anatina]|uniref:Uncharacterized protein LOC106176822 isoform X2 n=1 Tax=Lingula anatina TaxID=7574 RepID=A0A1S3JWK6_LINAN|nr:uncharacterized protein LOC106176822 isoform X2 [Lingula anatina]|eukprot:XP_013414810.1 uncharacterized protein LOC106176822 isoform X2 [Lingula anatina]